MPVYPWVGRPWMPPLASETFQNPLPPQKKSAEEGQPSSPLPHSLGDISHLHISSIKPQPTVWTGSVPWLQGPVGDKMQRASQRTL